MANLQPLRIYLYNLPVAILGAFGDVLVMLSFYCWQYLFDAPVLPDPWFRQNISNQCNNTTTGCPGMLSQVMAL